MSKTKCNPPESEEKNEASECCGTITSAAPYPQSQVITQFIWDKHVIKLRDGAGDNWPITWVDDELQITALGDGDGFDGQKRRLSLGFARIFGDPPNHRGEDFVSDVDTPEGGGPSGIKASGLRAQEPTITSFPQSG